MCQPSMTKVMSTTLCRKLSARRPSHLTTIVPADNRRSSITVKATDIATDPGAVSRACEWLRRIRVDGVASAR